MSATREHDIDFIGSYFGLEIDGLKIAFFTACSGLSMEFDVAETKQISSGGTIVQIKRPGRAKYTEVTLKRGFTQNKDLHDWFDKVVKANEKTPYKTAGIVVYDRQNKPVAKFNLLQCWPSKLSVSDLNASSDDVMIEELTIQHEELTWAP